MKEANIKVISYNNGERFMIGYNNFNPYQNKTIIPSTPRRLIKNQTMTKKQYVRMLREKHAQYYEFDLKPEKCKYLTLTTSKPMGWQELLNHFRLFYRNVCRNFGHVEYIRAVETFKQDLHYHIHILFIFNSEIPKEFDMKWVCKHWKWGSQIDLQDCNDPYGIIDYITLYKVNSLNENKEDETKFPLYARLITCSQGIPKSTKTQYYATINEVQNLYNAFKNNQLKGNYNFEFIQSHFYIDYFSGEIKQCIDKLFWH